MKTVEDVIAFAESKLGRPYVFGANGQLITREFVLAKARQYPSMYTQLYIDKSMKWVKVPPVDGYDCSGLIDVALGVDYNAQGYYANAIEKGKIVLYGDMPDVRGLLVFKYSSTQGKMSHIGIYIGNGKVIEARGVDYGVVKTDRTSSWTHWGKCHLIDYGGTNTVSLLKLGSVGSEVETLQKNLNAIGNYGLITDGDFGPLTQSAVKNFQSKNGLTVDGVVGEQTQTAIAKALEPPVVVPPVVDYQKIIDELNTEISALKARAEYLTIELANEKNISSSYLNKLLLTANAIDQLLSIRDEF